MSPQFVAAASIIRIEVERITDEYRHVLSGATTGTTAEDVSHLPCRGVGSIVGPQFDAAAAVECTEVERITDEYLHELSGGTADRSAVDISHPPS